MIFVGEGKLTQIIGAVLDIRFDKEELPSLYNAIHIPFNDSYIVAEVMQHLGNDTVRCVAMTATDGLQRGMKAIDTGAPIKVPVGDKVLGRVFNVLGDTVDDVAQQMITVYCKYLYAYRIEDVLLLLIFYGDD